MNKEIIVIGQTQSPPPPESYWTWDNENLSALSKSQYPALHCPIIPLDVDEAVSKYLSYLNDTGSGLTRLRQLYPRVLLRFTFGSYRSLDGISLNTNWHLESIRDGVLPIGIANQIMVNYPLYRGGGQLNFQDIPLHYNELDHLDHLHMETP